MIVAKLIGHQGFISLLAKFADDPGGIGERPASEDTKRSHELSTDLMGVRRLSDLPRF
jgi:hypothetical protein